MILKASQRGGGQDLAVHLLRLDDNDHVRVHELRGFAADDLRGAFKEAEAISRGTKCEQYLFSLSLNPPGTANASVATFEAAIDEAEKRLSLTGQPRAVVFHEKEGRRHAHCVWSRIDPATMTAKQMSFYKAKLSDLSRDLYLEHGWSMPNGLAFPNGRDPTNFTLAEWQRAKRLGQDPRWLKSVLQDCWQQSDGARAFTRALEEHGFFLAKGDRRGFVVLDHTGEVYSLPRTLSLKTKEVKERLGESEALPDVAATQALIGRRMTPTIRRHVGEARDKFQGQSAALGNRKLAMTLHHRDQRARLDRRQEKQRLDETRERASRLPTGFKSLWQRITGQYRKTLAAHEIEAAATRERHEASRERLVEDQRMERVLLQNEFRMVRNHQAEQLLSLRKEVGRFLSFTRQRETVRDQGRAAERGLGLSLER